MPFTISHFKTRSSARIWTAVAAVGGAAVLSGCVVAPMDDGYADYGYTSTTVYTTYDRPPPPRVEYRTIAPSPSHVWVGGDWFWDGGRYDWRPGRWAPPGYRPAPPPPRPHIQPPPRAPHGVGAAPQPRPPVARPDQRPRPPEFNAGQRPPAPNANPDSGRRPPLMRPGGMHPEQARQQQSPQRGDDREHRSAPSRGERNDDRRRP